MPYKFEVSYNVVEAAKNIYLQKVRVQLIIVQEPDGSRGFTRGASTSTIRQGKIDRKPRLCS